MRRVRNRFGSTNPVLMFASGVEQIVREKAENPTDYIDYEYDAMIRKEQSGVDFKPDNMTKQGFPVIDIIKVLSWIKP